MGHCAWRRLWPHGFGLPAIACICINYTIPNDQHSENPTAVCSSAVEGRSLWWYGFWAVRKASPQEDGGVKSARAAVAIGNFRCYARGRLSAHPPALAGCVGAGRTHRHFVSVANGTVGNWRRALPACARRRSSRAMAVAACRGSYRGTQHFATFRCGGLGALN